MWATRMGLLIQLLSARIGVATRRHLTELCREEYPYWAGLLLWFMAEFALIGADIQEVIVSAIAIKILSNGFFPIWAGIVITTFDCFIFLFLENYGVRKLEAVFAVLISTMALSFADAKPNGKELIVDWISREVLDAAARVIQPGVTTDEIDEVVHEATIASGGYPSPVKYNFFPKSFCTGSGAGPNAAAAAQFVRAEMLPSANFIRPCKGGGSIIHKVDMLVWISYQAS
ncbi:unnamed protein product [Camellia sinensis]